MEDETREIVVSDEDHALCLMMYANQERLQSELDHYTEITGKDEEFYYGTNRSWDYRVNKYTANVEEVV